MYAVKSLLLELTPSQRNVLKVALATEDGIEELRGELRIYTLEQRARNLALQGRTVELFDQEMVHDLAPTHRRVQAIRVMQALHSEVL